MESESKPSERDDRESSSDDLSDLSDGEAVQTQWLATTRQKRSTAGNRMKSMLANEEPDSDFELLFAEDENDQGFSDVDADASDMHMDSSSDEDDENNAADDLEGEKELEKQAKERRTAQRKRKAQDAIPAKFRKKVRIDPTTPAAPAPAPRPKKKSERASWLPSPADLPTRASSRQTTRLSKEQLHQQMVEREAKRLKQLAQMQVKAAKLEALKKPPMTQEERLREAATVEKRNSKSLNRWEEAEKQREEERRAKLAALHQRTLKGPVLTFWSGYGDWVDDKMKLVGRHIVIEEQPKKRKTKAEKEKEKEMEKEKEKEREKGNEQEARKENTEDKEKQVPEEQKVKEEGGAADGNAPAKQTTPSDPKTSSPVDSGTGVQASSAVTSTESPLAAPGRTETASTSVEPPPAATQAEEQPRSSTPKQEEVPKVMAMPAAQPPVPKPSGLAAPAPESPSPASGQSPGSNSLMAPPGISRPPEPKPSGVLAAPVLAPPPGIDVNSSSLGFSSPKSNVLAPPNTTQPVMPPSLSTAPTAARQATPLQPIDNSAALNQSASATPVESQPAPSSPSHSSSTTRNAIIYQNFDENAIKDKSVQTQILFGRKMNRLGKPSPAPLCVITNHVAKYRDPNTGLPYYNAYAYREIQRLTKGDYKWSRLLGAWVGSGTSAARGVPERFLNPNKKREPKMDEAGQEKPAAAEAGPAESGQPNQVKEGESKPAETGSEQQKSTETPQPPASAPASATSASESSAPALAAPAPAPAPAPTSVVAPAAATSAS